MAPEEVSKKSLPASVNTLFAKETQTPVIDFGMSAEGENLYQQGESAIWNHSNRFLCSVFLSGRPLDICVIE